MTIGGGAERTELRRYAQAIAMWTSRFDTRDIAEALNVPEAVAAGWVANFREQVRAAAEIA